MNHTKMMLFALLLLLAGYAVAETPIAWPDGKRVAVALTYDDSLASHLDHAVPALDRHGFRATFYLAVGSHSMMTRMPEWRDVAARGHELGNHTIYHPCSGEGPERDWVPLRHDLDRMTLAELRREIEVANVFLQAMDGKTRRTFASPCLDRLVGGEFYWPEIIDLFADSRDFDNGMPEGSKTYWGPVDPDTTGADLIRVVEDNSEDGSLIVIVFHGVGGDHLSVPTGAHDELLDFLTANATTYWVDTFLNIVDHVAAQSGGRAHDSKPAM